MKHIERVRTFMKVEHPVEQQALLSTKMTQLWLKIAGAAGLSLKQAFTFLQTTPSKGQDENQVVDGHPGTKRVSEFNSVMLSKTRLTVSFIIDASKAGQHLPDIISMDDEDDLGKLNEIRGVVYCMQHLIVTIGTSKAMPKIVGKKRKASHSLESPRKKFMCPSPSSRQSSITRLDKEGLRPGEPSEPGRGAIHSVTNPEFIEGTNRKNPFFETMPGPEVWHRRMPPFFPFGETPFIEQEMSRQISADLAKGTRSNTLYP